MAYARLPSQHSPARVSGAGAGARDAKALSGMRCNWIALWRARRLGSNWTTSARGMVWKMLHSGKAGTENVEGKSEHELS